MTPDSTWSGFLVPALHEWLPNTPVWLLTLLVGTVVSVVYGLVRKNVPEANSNPVHVVIPATITTVLGGVPGILMGAAGDGIRRAGTALFSWIGKRLGVK